MFMLKSTHNRLMSELDRACGRDVTRIATDFRKEKELLESQIDRQAKYIEQLKKRDDKGRFKKLDVAEWNAS